MKKAKRKSSRAAAHCSAKGTRSILKFIVATGATQRDFVLLYKRKLVRNISNAMGSTTPISSVLRSSSTGGYARVPPPMSLYPARLVLISKKELICVLSKQASPLCVPSTNAELENKNIASLIETTFDPPKVPLPTLVNNCISDQRSRSQNTPPKYIFFL